MNKVSKPETNSLNSDTILSRWRYIPEIWKLLWGLGAKEATLIAIFSVASGLVPILVVAILGRLIDSSVGAVIGTTSFKRASLWLAALLATSLLADLLESVNRWLGGDVQEKLKARVQERVLFKASNLSLRTFEQPQFYDQLQRAQKGLDTRLFSTMESLLPIPSLLVTAFGLLIYVGSAHVLFPAILLIGLLPLHFSSLRFAQRIYLLERRQTEPERMLSYLADLMTGRESCAEIRLLGLQSFLIEKRQKLFSSLRHERLTLARRRMITLMRSVLVEHLTYGLVIAGVVALVAIGRLTVGYFAAYLSAAERFRDAISLLLVSTRTVDNDLRYIRDFFEYLDIKEQADTRPQALAQVTRNQPDMSLHAVNGNGAANTRRAPCIRLQAVDFEYPGSARPALNGIDLTLLPGQHVALVGENGAGKTTFSKLLLGLYEPTRGRITADGIDLIEIDRSVWRGQVAAVFQDFVRYQLTPRENIGFGNLNRLRDEAAIREAATGSGADKVVASLPAGYETTLGRAFDEQGYDLSTGEWQKLALARAYLRDAGLLVLDEPTAALDARAEVETYKSFHDLSRGKTVLFISHRLGSARLADRILFLEKGRIVEEGSHDELMKLNGRYARMYSRQAGWYE
ncbi:MAG: ABC transporter ATP-binding protein [Blastocatellia bacterium]